jgi:DNA polymerase
MNKAEQLEKLKEEYKDCCKCPELCKNRHNIVFGAGEAISKIMIIGEAPGNKEDLENTPFVGKSGQILNSLLLETGISREEVYITNTILCRPPNNRDPTKEELEKCRTRLDKQIEIINPKVIITLGNFATKYILGTTKGITQLKGKVYDINNRKIVPMFHPAVLLYNGNNPEKRRELLADFEPVKELLELDKSGTLKDFY